MGLVLANMLMKSGINPFDSQEAKPYTRINIKFISGELNIDPTDVVSLLVSCILDSTINGRIDQVTGVLQLDKHSEGTARYTALDKWNTQLNNLQKLVINKMA